MGAELPYRKRVEFMLVTIFGTTFDKNSYWYGAPDPDTFFATILNMAGANKAVSASDGSEIFRIKPGTTSYEVNRGKLRALGVSERTLRDLFARTEAADVQHQIEPVGPLEVPLPEAVMAYAAEDRSMTPDAPAEVETQEDAARMLVDLFGGSQMEEQKTFTKLVTHGNTKVPIKVKKRASGKRKNRSDTLRETVDEATTKSVAETATTSASRDTLAATITAKPEANGRNRRKANAPSRNSKGKELDLGDDDEPDDAVAAKPIPDDDDTHSKALEANLARRLCLAPRDGSHRPLPFLDYGWDPELEPKSIAQLHEDNEFFLAPEASGDDAPTCGAANDDPLLGVEDFVDFDELWNSYVFPSFEQNPELEHRRQSTRMLFSKFRAELHDILRGTEVAEKVFEQLDVLLETADMGLLRNFALRGE